MSVQLPAPEIAAITSNERATPSLVYRALLRGIREGQLVPGGKIPNERDLASQLNTSRTAVRTALAMMERQGLVSRKIGSGTYLTENAQTVFESMDQTSASAHEDVPSFVEIAEGRLLFEPAMMNLVCARVEDQDIERMRVILGRILDAPSWHDFKEQIYALHRQIYEATKNRFLVQIMESILADRRAVAFDGRDGDQPTPAPVRRQTHEDLAAIVEAIANRDAEGAEQLTSDHLLRTLATINIWH